MLPQQDAVLLLVKTALRKALKLIRGLRKRLRYRRGHNGEEDAR
jgi:hypothetical protein